MIGTFLLLSLTACSSNPVLTHTEVQKVPAALLSPCEKSSGAKTYLEAIQLAEKRGRELDECNKRLEDIRRWSEGS